MIALAQVKHKRHRLIFGKFVNWYTWNHELNRPNQNKTLCLFHAIGYLEIEDDNQFAH